MNKRLTALLLSVFIVVFMSGCGKKTSNSGSAPTADTSVPKHSGSSITLLFNKSDSLDPYSAKTENNRLITKLLFEPLVKTDNDINPVYRLAKEVRLDGRSCTVTIRDALFSDGSTVTAGDVVYSYNRAKSYGGLYTSHLYEVSSAQAASDTTIVFSLTQNDPFFANLLDFPVIKSGSDRQTDSDGKLKTPIGCGRYLPTGDPFILSQNSGFFGEKGDIKKIKLINAPDDDSVSHYIEVGAADLYYSDMSDDNVVRMSGKRTDVNLNTLVYIGVNTGAANVSERYLRYAISSALDRTALCRDAFFNSASPATGYFNPSLGAVAAVQSLRPAADTEITVDNLKKMGYNDKNAEGYFTDANGKHPVLKLLVNRESRSKLAAAKLIAGQLKTAGIQLTVVECSYTEYLNRLSTNSFELYLGEISVLPNFDMSGLVLPGGSAAYGIAAPDTREQGEKDDDTSAGGEAQDTSSEPDAINRIYSEYRAGTASISDVAATLITEMPQIPLLFRHGLLFSNDSLENVRACESDIFFSVEYYKIKQDDI